MKARAKQWGKTLGECFVLPIFLMLVVGVWWPWLKAAAKLSGRAEKPRIIWGPTPIITIAANAAADRLYGYQSDTLVYRPYFITEEFTYNLERWWRWTPAALILPWAVFLWASLRYDIFQLFYDGGFLNRTIAKRLEFPLLKLLGKKIIVTAYGADVRTERKTRALGPYSCCTDCTSRLTACICDEEKANRNLRHIRRYADMMLSMGDMIEYTPGSRNDLFYWAIDLSRCPFVGVSRSSSPVTVVHAPNHPEFKGTRYLVSVVQELKSEGYPVELVQIQGVPNVHAKALYARADIIADQFLIGWHGYFAIEAMALGKPVIAYIRKSELYLPQGAECPIVSASPEALKQALARLVEDPNLRWELGVKGRRYVEQVYSVENVGRRFDRLYRTLWGGVSA